jgi:hypothetical protein
MRFMFSIYYSFVEQEDDWMDDLPVEIKTETHEDPPTFELESKDDGNEMKIIVKANRKRNSTEDEDTEDKTKPIADDTTVNSKTFFNYRCDIEGCTRGFRKKLTLDAHKRAHSGKDVSYLSYLLMVLRHL